MIRQENIVGKICHVVGAGPLYDYRIEKINDDDMIIAADGGLDYLKNQKISPELIIGDFDSVEVKPSGENIITLPAEKDDTDMIAAIRIAMEKGYRNFFLYAGTGRRVDHTLANIQTLAFLNDNGARGWLLGEDNVITSIKNSSIILNGGLKEYISVLSYTDVSEGVTLKNLKYAVDNFTMTSVYPIGTSNELLGASAEISVRNGILIVIYER